MPLGFPAGDYGFVSRAFEFWYDIIVMQLEYVACQICYEDLTIETYFILVFADFYLSFQLCTWLFCRRSCRVRCVACIGVSRYLTTQEVSAALRPFYFIVHPDLFGQFPNERVCKLYCVCVCVCVCACARACLHAPQREAGYVWCLSSVWNLRAVIWFPCPISSCFFLPSALALCLVIFLLMVHSPDFFPENSQIFFVKG